MNGVLEYTANGVSSFILLLDVILFFFAGMSIIIHGFYKVCKNNKKDGLKYIGTGLALIDVVIILPLLFILIDNITNKNETDNKVIFIFVGVVLLFLISMIICNISDRLKELIFRKG